MAPPSDIGTIRAELDRYRSFEECLLREVRLTSFGTALELEFDYIWDRKDWRDWRVAEDPSVVLVRLELLEEVEMHLPLPEGLFNEPELADWGLNEIALVRLEEAPMSAEPEPRASRTRHKLVVQWEGERRIEAVFGRLRIEEQGDGAQRR